MSGYQQLVVMPGKPRRHCCSEFSLCCCQCCLGTSIVLAIIFFVIGALLLSAGSGFGVALLILGGITTISVLVSAACVCCLTPKRTGNSGVVVVNHPVAVPNSPPLQSFAVNPAFQAYPTPSAPTEPPPSYEIATKEKV